MVKAGLNAESTEFGMKHNTNTEEAGQETLTSRWCQDQDKDMQKIFSVLHHSLIPNRLKMIEM